MATSAFKSNTKRTPIGTSGASVNDSASSNRGSIHRRSRSLSRFSHRIPSTPAAENFDEIPAPRERFVNTVRGSGFPEISLDDLAAEFFGSGDRGRSDSRNSEPSSSSSVASQRRGRSVSRQKTRTSGGATDTRGSISNSSGGNKIVTETNPRRRRSVSVVRYQISDSESDLDQSRSSGSSSNHKSFGRRNSQILGSHKPNASNHRPVLRRSFSQKELKLHDGYSSHSSVLTDDEGKDVYFSNNGIDRNIQVIYAKTKANHSNGNVVNDDLHEAMRKELRHAVEGIRVELEQAMLNGKLSSTTQKNVQSKNSDVLQAVSLFRNNSSTELDLFQMVMDAVYNRQSQKRKQDLLAEIVLEEQRGRELSKVVKHLLPDPKKIIEERPLRARKRSNDRSRMSKRLTAEAERYFEDFISNVEDTDISSLDGERSDTSSSIGGIMKSETFQSPAASSFTPVEMEGVVLPWLKWETSNDTSPLPNNIKKEAPMTPKTIPWDLTQFQKRNIGQDQSNHSASSHGSWSPGIPGGLSTNIGENRYGEPSRFQSNSSLDVSRESQFDMEEYVKLRKDDDFLLERWRQQHRIKSGGLLICNQMFH